MNTSKMGVHIILDLFECPREKLESAEEIEKVCLQVVRGAKLTMLEKTFHQFSPSGATGFVLLAESHMSIHTWPEYQSVSVDIFNCFLSEKQIPLAKKKAAKACRLLIKKFAPGKIKKATMMR